MPEQEKRVPKVGDEIWIDEDEEGTVTIDEVREEDPEGSWDVTADEDEYKIKWNPTNSRWEVDE